MIRVSIFIHVTLLLVLLAVVPSLDAQQELIAVSIEPDRTDWDWQSYAESVTSPFVNSIESRVTAGFEQREFERDTSATVLRFAFRIGMDGKLLRFTQLTHHNRYHAYLIHRSAEKIIPFRALPGSFPAFYFDGLMTFTCRFQPTRWYKKLYFEQPLDTLELPQQEPLVRTIKNADLLTPVYEPIVMDKKQLLEEFKTRIGIAAEITDTSSYTPLPVAGRLILVHVPYDSLSADSQNRLLLQARIERALEENGARISNEEYDPGEIRRRNAEAEARAAEIAARDSAAAAAAATLADSMQMEAMDSMAAETDSSLAPATPAVAQSDTTITANPDSAAGLEMQAPATGDSAGASAGQPPDSLSAAGRNSASTPGIGAPAGLEPGRNLTEAFQGVYKEEFLVFSAGLARDTSSADTALCRIKLYPGPKPSDLKRNLVYKFRYQGRLPDSIGVKLVERLTKPPAKPKPPPKPKAAAKTPVVATVDTTAGGDTTAVATTAQPAVTGAAADSTAPSPAAAATDSISAIAGQGAVKPGATTPTDTTAAPAAADSTAAPAPDSSVTPPDTTAAPPAPAADSTAPAADSSAAPAKQP